MKISHTTYPEQRLSENEWMKTFKVSTQVPKYDGIERAKQIMKSWNTKPQKPKGKLLERLTHWFSVS